METTALIQTPNRDKELVLANSTTEQAPNSRRYRLAGDAVFSGTKNLPEDQRDQLRWLHHHLHQNDIPVRDIAHKLKKENRDPYSADSIYQAMTGRRDADSKKICDAIARYRDYIEREQATVKTGFIETSLTQRVFAACDRALRRHRIVFIFGESQIGKSVALAEYARRNNHGQTVYVRMPTSGPMTSFVTRLAEALGISPALKVAQLRSRIIKSFDPSMLLIVDECHQALRELSPDRAVNSVEFAREIIDLSGCAGVFCGTNEFHDAVRTGRNAGILKQLWLRRLSPVYLPNIPNDADLTIFAKAYGLSSAAPRKEVAVTTTDPNSGDPVRLSQNPYDLQTEIARADGLGRWVAILQEAADNAADQDRPITWGHVLLAHAGFQHMEHEEDQRPTNKKS